LGKGLVRVTGHQDWTAGGQHNLLTWTTYQEYDEQLRTKPERDDAPSDGRNGDMSPVDLALLRQKLEWRYASAPATVTALNGVLQVSKQQTFSDILSPIAKSVANARADQGFCLRFTVEGVHAGAHDVIGSFHFGQFGLALYGARSRAPGELAGAASSSPMGRFARLVTGFLGDIF